MRLIDAEALEELFRETIHGIAMRTDMQGALEHMIRASAMVVEMIKDAPTIDALHLLKAQEPRVMTLQEALGAEVNVDQCWLEFKYTKLIYLADAVVCPEHTGMADIQRWGASNCQLPLDLYGSCWRMWDRKPTKEQREATPWNGLSGAKMDGGDHA